MVPTTDHLELYFGALRTETDRMFFEMAGGCE